MTKFIGSGVLSKFSQEVILQKPIAAVQIPQLLDIQKPLADHLILVRDHHMLSDSYLVNDNDEIFLFLAVMGG